MLGERFPIPAVDFDEVDEGALRRIVPYRTSEYPGTRVVDTRQHALFLIMEEGDALRCWCGQGGVGLVWPRWTPTRDMIAREPEGNAPWAGDMPPAIENPLGAPVIVQN